jgi:hypothetical protein
MIVNATPAQVAAATTILARLIEICEPEMFLPAMIDMRSIIAHPECWETESAAWAMESAIESTAEWTSDGYEDSAARSALNATLA